MEEKVKNWIKIEYEYAVKHGHVSKAIDRCYGVMMFATNELFDGFNENLAQWWDSEMLPMFRKAEWEE